MNYLKSLAVVSAFALLFPLASLAKTANERSVDIPGLVRVGNTQLKPGTYKVEWQGAGPAVRVDFMEHGKTIATAPATLKINDSQVYQNDIVTDPSSKNGRTLREIDFGHDKVALMFPRHRA